MNNGLWGDNQFHQYNLVYLYAKSYKKLKMIHEN